MKGPPELTLPRRGMEEHSQQSKWKVSKHFKDPWIAFNTWTSVCYGYSILIVGLHNVWPAHTGFLKDFRHHCNTWAILDSGALIYLTGAMLVPFIILLHFVLFKQCIKLFTCLWMAVFFFFYFLGLLSMLIIDLAGHLCYANDQDVGSHCMFTYIINLRAGDLFYLVLELHWAILLPPISSLELALC